MSSLKEEILADIREHKVSIKPKWRFGLRLTGILALSALILFLSVFLFNFMFFSIRVSHHHWLLSLGMAGIWAFLINFPWPFLFADIILIILLELLLRNFRFGYRSPTLYLFLAILALAISAGILIDATSDINERLYDRAEKHELFEPLQPFYEHARRPFPCCFPTSTYQSDEPLQP